MSETVLSVSDIVATLAYVRLLAILKDQPPFLQKCMGPLKPLWN